MKVYRFDLRTSLSGIYFLLLLIFLPNSFVFGENFKRVVGPIENTSVEAAHREYGTEWWYFTGHLEDINQRKFGFELTFFRVGLRKKQLSTWEAQSLVVAHFALSDEQNNLFLFSEEKDRESFDLAGASNKGLNVWLKDWSAVRSENKILLKAKDSEKSIELSFESKKPIVFHGDRGFSKKGAEPGEASIYTSLTRLEGGGLVTIGEQQFKVKKASAWMDHEFFTSSDKKGAKSWDWFALQLSNNEEIMLYQLTDSNGEVTKFSSGTLVKSDGSYLPLPDFKIETLATWKSPKSGISYPSKWRIKALNYDLTVSPTIANQEITGSKTTGVNYWEGRSIVSGSHSGEGYVELVGYR